MTRTTATLLLTALLTVGIAGCDSGGSGGKPAASASAAADRGQLLALGQEWVQCLRNKGLTRMPDAEVSQDGYLEFPVRGYNWKEDLQKHKDTIEACRSIEDRYPPNAFRPKQQFSADDLRKLAAYAECVRQHGIPAFPDPNSAGEFDLGGTSLQNGISPRLRDQADEACRTIWSGAVKITGQTGGVKK